MKQQTEPNRPPATATCVPQGISRISPLLQNIRRPSIIRERYPVEEQYRIADVRCGVAVDIRIVRRTEYISRSPLVRERDPVEEQNRVADVHHAVAGHIAGDSVTDGYGDGLSGIVTSVICRNHRDRVLAFDERDVCAPVECAIGWLAVHRDQYDA